MKNMEAVHPYLATELRAESAPEGEFPKMEIRSYRPSVIQARRDQPPCKLQRMNPEAHAGSTEREAIPRKAESDVICDDQETQVILKYIHKKFSKYQRIALF